MVMERGRVRATPAAGKRGDARSDDAVGAEVQPTAGWLPLVLVFLLPVLAAFGPLVPGIGSLFLFRVLALLFLCAAVFSVEKGVRSVLRTLTVVLAAVWLLVAGMGLMVSGLSPHAFGELLSLGTGLALLVAVAIMRAPMKLLMALLYGWLFAYAIISLFAVAEILTGVSLSASYADERTLDGWGITVTFYNPNNYATFLLFSFVALVVLWGRTRSRLIRSVTIVGLVSIPFFMNATNSRTGIMVLAVFVVTSILMLLRGRVGVKLALVLLALVGAIVLLDRMEQTPFEGFAQFLGTSGNQIDVIGIVIPVDISTFVRWNLVLVGLALAGSSPLLGGGPGSFENYVAISGAQDQTLGIVNPHNGFIEVLAQYGFVVFALFIFWLLRILRTGIQARRHPERSSRVVWIALAFGVISLPIVLTMHSSAIEPSTTWIFFALLVLAARVQETAGEKEIESEPTGRPRHETTPRRP
jgi:putative inorganic carbon (HCO3(-)) transporter